MEELLQIQPRDTIKEWCKERGVVTIDSYYSYLDALISSTSILISEALTNEVILSNIFSKCYEYILIECQRVCKTWGRIIGKVATPIISYGEDAVLHMDWYHIARAMTNSSFDKYLCVHTALKRGYELKFEGFDFREPQHLSIIASNSDCSARYYNLFVRYSQKFDYIWCNKNSVLKSSVLKDSVLKGCIVSGDLVLFKYAYKYLDSYYSDITAVYNAAYYGRVDFIRYILNNTNLSDNEETYLGIVTASHCGGNTEVVLEYCQTLPIMRHVSNSEILQLMMFSTEEGHIPIFLDVLTRAITSVYVGNESVLNILYPIKRSCHIQHTVEEFARLWYTLTKDKNIDKLRLCQCIGWLLNSNKRNTVRFILTEARVSQMLTLDEVLNYLDRHTTCRNNHKQWLRDGM